MEYKKFKLDRGWAYKTEEALTAAYLRLKKSHSGVLLTQDEFLLEAERPDNEKTKAVYRALAALCKAGKIAPADVYQFARFKWCITAPETIVSYQAAPNTWLVNNCDTAISEEKAKQETHDEFGFEEDLIKVIGTPYYDATDWNFIRFDCRAWSWLIKNGEIYSVYGG